MIKLEKPQIKKGDRIKPVLTLVVYYGEKPWDGPLNLGDMLDIPPVFRPLFNDQRIHLIQVRDFNGQQFENPVRFPTDR